VDDATDLGGARRDFPRTSWTLICEARRRGPGFDASWNRLVELYWKPVYWYVRTRWRKSNEDAKDLTQEFFATLLDKETLDSLREDRPRFRTFLQTCLEHFLLHANRDRARIKRGGRAQHVSIDARACRIDVPARGLSPEESFDRAWAQTILDESLGELEAHYRKSGKLDTWEAFERYHLAGSSRTYAAVAKELGLSADDVQNRLKHARNTLSALLRARVLETIADPADVEDELAHLVKHGLGA
jgi:RNA polymerase sigma-70 factor (ECF subfamily)